MHVVAICSIMFKFVCYISEHEWWSDDDIDRFDAADKNQLIVNEVMIDNGLVDKDQGADNIDLGEQQNINEEFANSLTFLFIYWKFGMNHHDCLLVESSSLILP